MTTTTLYALFYDRGNLDTVTPRGAPFAAVSAEGGEVTNGIGYGKAVIPLYDNFRRPWGEQVQQGDLCFVYSTAPYVGSSRALMVACFIVDTRQQRGDETYEISGPDLLGELTEFYAVAPVGTLSDVTVYAISLGSLPGNVTLQAAYPSRAYMVKKTAPAGTYVLQFTESTSLQETDTMRYEYGWGEVFTTTVTEISVQRDIVTLADPLPHVIYPADHDPPGGKVSFQSTRLMVSDASALIEGSHVFYTPGTAEGYTSGNPQGNLLIDRVEVGEGGDPDYIYTADPITDQIDAGTPMTQMQYTAPTTIDVAMLLAQSTSLGAMVGQWSVIRSPLATIGTAYAPSQETVWDVLMAISEMSGYQFRRYFRGLNLTALGQNPFADWRQIEYFPPGYPIVAGEVQRISAENTISVFHATILSPIQTEDVGQAVTTLFPFGGGAGSGAFDFHLANIDAILSEYGGKIGWGIKNRQYFVYNKVLVQGGARLVATSETFAHISPLDNTLFDSRKEAANQLLRAACEWLLLHDRPQVTYVVDVFTIGEPRVGDVVTLSYSGNSPHSTTDTALIITDVRHRVDPQPGYRVTTLTLNKAAFPIYAGARTVARELTRLKRALKQANIGARGDARISYDRMEFGQDATVDSKTGNMLIRSQQGSVTVRADMGDVALDGNTIAISGLVDASGVIRSDMGFVLRDLGRSHDWEITAQSVRRIPRIALDFRETPT